MIDADIDKIVKNYVERARRLTICNVRGYELFTEEHHTLELAKMIQLEEHYQHEKVTQDESFTKNQIKEIVDIASNLHFHKSDDDEDPEWLASSEINKI